MSLDVVCNPHQNPQHAQTLDCHLLPHVVLGTGRPGQKGADVLGELRESGRGPIVVLDDLVIERRGLGTIIVLVALKFNQQLLAVTMPIAPPGKYGLKFCPSLSSMPAGGSQ